MLIYCTLIDGRWRHFQFEEGCFERPLASLRFNCIVVVPLRSRKKSGVSIFSFSISKSPFFNQCVCPPPPPQKKTRFLYKFMPGFERTLPHPRSKSKKHDDLDRSTTVGRQKVSFIVMRETHETLDKVTKEMFRRILYEFRECQKI